MTFNDVAIYTLKYYEKYDLPQNLLVSHKVLYFVIIGRNKLPRFYIQTVIENNNFRFIVDEFTYDDSIKQFKFFNTIKLFDGTDQLSNFILNTNKIIPYNERKFKELNIFMKTLFQEMNYKHEDVCYDLIETNLNFNFTESEKLF